MILLSLLLAPAIFRISAAQHIEASQILPRGDGVDNKIPETTPFRCPVNDMLLTQCRGEKDCVYPNPSSCTSYIQCSASPSLLSGTPAIKNCLIGHEWNDKDKKCDVPEKSTCPVKANAKGPEDGLTKTDSKGKVPCTGVDCQGPTLIGGVSNGAGDVLEKVGVLGRGFEKKAREAQSKDTVPCTGVDCPGPTLIGAVANGAGAVLEKVGVLGRGSEKKAREAQSKDTVPCTGVDCPGPTLIGAVANGAGAVLEKVGVLGRGSEKKSGEAQSKDKVPCTGAECTGPTVIGAVANGAGDVLKKVGVRAPSKAVHARADFKCPTEDLQTKCKGANDCRHADPKSCSHFYLCSVNAKEQTAVAQRLECGKGLLWNDNSKACDWPQASTCKL